MTGRCLIYVLIYFESRHVSFDISGTFECSILIEPDVVGLWCSREVSICNSRYISTTGILVLLVILECWRLSFWHTVEPSLPIVSILSIMDTTCVPALSELCINIYAGLKQRFHCMHIVNCSYIHS